MLEYINCNICGSSEYKIINTCGIMKEDACIPEETLDIVKCGECGLLYVNPRPKYSEQETQGLYNEEYFSKDYMKYYDINSENKVVQSNESFSYRLDLIEKYKKCGKLLDIGCATGGFLDEARKRNWDVSGVELSSYAAESAVKKRNLNVFKGYLEEARFGENNFDIVCAGDILEHTSDPKKFLLEIRRIIKKDGIIYLAFPNADSFYYKFFGSIARYNHKNYFVLPHHLYHFSPSTIAALLDKIGLGVLQFKFSRSKSKSFFMNIFNFKDRLLVIAKKTG